MWSWNCPVVMIGDGIGNAKSYVANCVAVQLLSMTTVEMILRQCCLRPWLLLFLLCMLAELSSASYGDRMPEFRHCVEICKSENCGHNATPLALHLRLLFWNCGSECDYTCQHIVSHQRLALDPPISNPIVQYHGKWPFIRVFGIQEPLSVLFSFLNLWAHIRGLSRVRTEIPSTYPLRPYYECFAYFGIVSWILSSAFHTRDYNITETADYLAAGGSVLYGFYYTPIRIFSLHLPQTPRPTLLRLWTILCASIFIFHCSYLLLIRWDYSYNMAFAVVLGITQNTLWSVFSVKRYREKKRMWAAWPGLIVAWILVAMSFELLDFPPWGGWLDAHALWHLGTVGPTIWWYGFLVKDSREEQRGERLKA